MSHELIKLVETAPQEVPSTEEVLGDYGLFWRFFGQVLFSRVLMQEFNGNTEEFMLWAEGVWEQHPYYEHDIVKYCLIEPQFASGARYSVGLIPKMIYYPKGLSHALDPGFTIKIWPKLERERIPGDTGTYMDILADSTPVKLDLWSWVGGEEILAFFPITLYFQEGKMTKISPAPNLSYGEGERLVEGVKEGPISEIWFPRNFQ